MSVVQMRVTREGCEPDAWVDVIGYGNVVTIGDVVLVEVREVISPQEAYPPAAAHDIVSRQHDMYNTRWQTRDM